MSKKQKRPLSVSTAIEVAKFRLSHQYSIPTEHHYNLLMGIGANKDDLRKYILYSHTIDIDAIIDAIEASEETSKHLLNSKSFVRNLANSYNYCKDLQNILAEKRGILWMVENDFMVITEIWNEFFKNATNEQLDKLIPHISVMHNGIECILKSNYLPLIKECVKTFVIAPKYEPLLLRFDDVSLYEEWFDENENISPETIDVIVSEKSDEIVSMLVSKFELNDEQTSLLIKRKNWDLLASQLNIQEETMSSSNVALLTKIADDELFEKFALADSNELGDVLQFPKIFFERLFEPQNREILKKFLTYNNLPSEFEIRLLQSDDNELKESYCSETRLEDETAIFVLKSGNDKLIEQMISGNRIGYYAEAWLFKSDLHEYMKTYLSCNNHYLCPFSEAVLLRHGPVDIVKEHITKMEEVSELSFRAVMERGNVDIIKDILKIYPHFNLKERFMQIFFEFAPVDVIICHFDKYYPKAEGLIGLPKQWDDTSRYVLTLINRNDVTLQRYFVNRFKLMTDDVSDFIKYGNRDVIFDYIKNNELEDSDTVTALLNRRDAEITAYYLDKYEILDYTLEEIILTYFDEEIVRKLQNKAGFGDYSVREMLDI